MAEVFIPRQPSVTPPVDHPSAAGPLAAVTANPHFVFPTASDMSIPSATETGETPSVDRSRPQRLSILPAFDFNPSGTSDLASGSSRCTPTKTTPPYSNISSGHRRNGSEFIGGDGKVGTTAPLSASPTKGAFSLALPASLINGPPASRRGHAHRRSGAVSSNDLSNVLKPTNESRGASLPTTPSDTDDRYKFSPHLDRSSSQPQLPSSSKDGAETLDMDYNARSKVYPRARVGFSDTIEFIPRPLSTISSETSSSLSTIRASHSVTGSISSIISGDTSSPPTNRFERLSGDLVMEQSNSTNSPSAPSSAFYDARKRQGASPKSKSLDQSSSLPALRSTIAHNDHVAALSRSAEDLPRYDIPIEEEDPPQLSVDTVAQLQGVKRRPVLVRPKSSPEPKITKQQKKVKSWAGAFLPRKPRTPESFPGSRESASYTAPSVSFAPADDLPLEHFNFDDDTTCVIRDASQVPASPRNIPEQSNRRPLDMDAAEEDEISGQVLDLDAAFESLNTPSLGSDFEDATEGGFTAARRRMHSSGATGGFTGPGMHYHRRAESAPELVPIDYHPFGFPRFGSNPRMADVFEEEEEDNDDESLETGGRPKLNDPKPWSTLPSRHNGEDMTTGLGVQIVDVDSVHDKPDHMRGKLRQASNYISPQKTLSEEDFRTESTTTYQKQDATLSRNLPAEMERMEEESVTSLTNKSPSDHAATPTLPAKPMFIRPVSAPLDYAITKSHSPSMTTDTLSSTVSSPDFSRISFDTPRLHTAHSSITDHMTLNSCRVGEHSNNFRPSVEDVPSLTSSASTMASAQPPRFSSGAYTRSSAERSSSLSDAVQYRARPKPASKRSSLASLSRLVGSSYGEKSKLNIEECAQLERPETTENKRRSRISRMMFWKSKEKL